MRTVRTLCGDIKILMIKGYPDSCISQLLYILLTYHSSYSRFHRFPGSHQGRNGIFVVPIVAPLVGMSVIVGVSEGVGVIEMVDVAVAVGVMV